MEVGMIILFGIVLKIPVGFGIWLVWWASREYDEEAEGHPPAAEDHGFRRWRRQPKHPRDPRRGGPHGGLAVATPPERNRVLRSRSSVDRRVAP